MEKILSIIIPTYNMERYLRYCLDSLLIQNNLEKIEVLVINDGSKDSSSEIAHSYESRFPAVFRVLDKENGNYGSCINRGLSIAVGKYVKVLDADDSFNTENFERFVTYLMAVDADLVLSDFVVVDEDRKEICHKTYGFPSCQPLNMSDVCVTESFKDMQMHAVTYRLENLLKMQYRQIEGISYTDQQWICMPMSMVKSVCYFDQPVYRYLVGRPGQTMDPSVTRKQMSHFIKCSIGMVESYKSCECNLEDFVDEYLKHRIVTQLKSIYVTGLTELRPCETIKYLVPLDKYLKSHATDIYQLIQKTNRRINYIRIWRVFPVLNTYVIRFFILLLKI